MISLNDLLQEILPSLSLNIEIKGLSLDSRTVKQGDLFFAYPGTHVDGRHFIDDAIKNGAAAVLQEGEGTGQIIWSDKVPVITVKDLYKQIGPIAANFYNASSTTCRASLRSTRPTYTQRTTHHAQRITHNAHHTPQTIIGITGTNGKTSVTRLLTEALILLGKKAAMISTLGYGQPAQLKPLDYTTPDALTLQKILHEFDEAGIEVVVIEASSHALDQARVGGIEFNMGIFTNLTRDHLDYHQNMENYAQAKKMLFEIPSMKQGIFNLDDPMGVEWGKEFADKMTVCGYSTEGSFEWSDKIKHVLAETVQLMSKGLHAELNTSWGAGHLDSLLLGRFNLSNLLAVLSALCSLGYELSQALSVISQLHAVPGRMQVVHKEKFPLIIIDFAHAPDALEKALVVAREHCDGQLFVVFGCGGDRDRGKRPMMGEIASRLADQVIVTDDNVRFEKSQDIIDEILQGIGQKEPIQTIPNRRKAIVSAIRQAEENDVVLLAGKGHEQYQIIGNKKLPFDEVAIVKQVLRKVPPKN